MEALGRVADRPVFREPEETLDYLWLLGLQEAELCDWMHYQKTAGGFLQTDLWKMLRKSRTEVVLQEPLSQESLSQESLSQELEAPEP